MRTQNLFRRLPVQTEQVLVNIRLNQQDLSVPAGISVAAALLLHGQNAFHHSAVNKLPRGPYCMMGVCFGCLVEIDGKPNQQACLINVREGMLIRTMVTPPQTNSSRGEKWLA